MNTVNRKMIDAVIEKARKVCPDSLALIGVYGSAATGDVHERSDLDLLILIEDDEGRKLGTAFILDDNNVGYDIYCTSWEDLKFDAECHHAQIAKLMDAKIVYTKDREAYERLCKLREAAKRLLTSEERFQRVRELMDKAKLCYANLYLQDALGQVRLEAFGMMHYLMEAVMLFHGRYFRRGTKRMPDELAALPLDAIFADSISGIAAGRDAAEIRIWAKRLFTYVEGHTRQDKGKRPPSEALAGTYEEMYSNWRNKVDEAAKQNNLFASFVNMCSFHHMLAEISSEVATGTYNVMEHYRPDRLEDNVRLFDDCLLKYAEVYEAAGLSVKHFSDVDAFVEEYLCK